MPPKDKKLSEAETYANQALQLIPNLPKQATETDDQVKKRKDALTADLHSALGMVHLQSCHPPFLPPGPGGTGSSYPLGGATPMTAPDIPGQRPMDVRNM